ncbi:MAG: hypothetical protein PWR20_1624 [Bacteroidales bacterium]|jgi:hypothetical protein|nr:hypothetical protein [Bacteroidales bacterium]
MNSEEIPKEKTKVKYVTKEVTIFISESKTLGVQVPSRPD